MVRGTSGSIRVLHVDDEPDFADMTALFLKRHDEQFEVETETSVRDGIDRLTENEYDCIVSDFDMPRQNGIEFLRAVREDYPELPFILYTGKGSEAVASEAISAGVTDYLQKESGTSQYEVLANRIKNVVGQFHTRRELERSQDLLEHTEKLANVGGWEADVQTGKQRWTKGTYEIHGIDPDSDFDPTVAAGINFYHPDDRDEIERVVEQCMEKGEAYDVELRLITADDRLCWVQATGEPVWNDGDIVTIRGAIRDITNSKERERELSEEKEKYSTLVEQSHDGILVLQDEKIKFVNEQAGNILQFEESELLGKSMLETVAPQDRERIKNRYHRRLDPETESPPAQYDMQLLTKDGEQRYANISVAKIQFDGEPADLVSFRDITDHKHRERKIERERDRLHQFAGVVSHDLQNPLNVIEGRLQLARKDCDSDHLRPIGNALDRMNRIIEDLLWLAHEGKDIGTTESVDLQEAVRSAWRVVDDGSNSIQFVEKTAREQTIQADIDRLAQILENIFRNALEHGGDTITVGVLEDGFYIEDDGPGIPVEERDKIFETGYSTSEEGIGLGLSIVKEIIEAHNWDIEATEGAQGGARFEITGTEFTAE